MENIEKKLNIKVVTLLAIIVLLALFAFFTNYAKVGVVLSLVAIALLFCGVKKEIYTLTGSPVKRLTFYFESNNINNVERSIKAILSGEAPQIKFLPASNGRMDVFITKDRKYAVVTLSRYVPHKYEPVGEAIKFMNHQVKALCNYLQI